MILQESIGILPDDTTGSLEARLAGSGEVGGGSRAARSGGLVEALTWTGSGQKAPKIKKEFGLIDWTKPPTTSSGCARATVADGVRSCTGRGRSRCG